MTFPQAFPLTPAGVPAVRWSDESTCRPSSAFGPGDAYGLPTGPRNGVWVLDLDRKNGKDGVVAISEYAATVGGEVPETYAVRTRSGGVHLYFRWDAARPPVGNRAGILEGVDVRGLGGYVRAGAGYDVLADVPIADAPDWLYDFVGHRQAAGGESAHAIGPDHPEWVHRLAMAREFLASAPPCVSGQGGQEQLWKIALRLMRTYELPVETVAGDLLTEYNARCVPPWAPHEITRTLLRAAEAGHGPTGTFAAGSALLTPVPVPVDDAPLEVWRQVPSKEHAYLDISSIIAGAVAKGHALGPQELAAGFTGPGAVPHWRGVWQYDAFRRRLLAVNPPIRLDAETIGLSKRDLAAVQVWIACGGGRASLESIANAVEIAGKSAEFHPVLDYLDSLEKVPVANADAYFTGIAGRLWGATDRDDLESGHLRRLAIAAVRRIRRPGTKVDVMLVLAGEQGFRKSALCSLLFGDWFLDQVPPLDSGRGVEASIAIAGRWGVEIAEMNAFSRSQETTKKEFLTRCSDKYRPVFGKDIQEFPRQCVFIGTTNDDDFLTDPTGDTRYDVVDVREPIRLELLERDEFWAAASALEASGELHYTDRAALARDGKSAERTAGFQAEDLWTDRVLKYARTVKPMANGEAWVTAKACIDYGLVIPAEKQDARALTRVKGILRRTFGASRVVWIDERAQRAYRVGG